MCIDIVQEPLYLSIARWVMNQQRWVCPEAIAEQFDISQSKAINAVSYILASVSEIKCATKTIPNNLEGRGCQCQRLFRVSHIDEAIVERVQNAVNPGLAPVRLHPKLTAPSPLAELNLEEKWHRLLAKSPRKSY